MVGELLPTRPVAVNAAIVGVDGTDHVIEVISYPNEPAAGAPTWRQITHAGLSHVGLVRDDIEAMRADLEAKGVELLTAGSPTSPA